MAAEQGEVRAQCNLGVLLRDPQGAPRNPAEAAIWFREAADQGVPQAQYAIGLMLADGQGVSQNTVDALQIFYACCLSISDRGK